MSQPTFYVFLAVVVQVLLTLALVWYQGIIRVRMVSRGEVNVRDVALNPDKWPERERKVAHALADQFQLPILFYIVCMAAVSMGADLLDVVLAWGFVIARLIHLAVYVTDSNVVRRFWAYSIGLGVLTIFWLVLSFRFIIAALLFGMR